MGKTLTTTQQAWGLPWEPGVLGGETHMLENRKFSKNITDKYVKYAAFQKHEPRIG